MIKEELINRIRNAEYFIEQNAPYYHAKESDCPDSFKFLMLLNGWYNPFIALNELLKVIYTNEMLLKRNGMKKGYKSRYREMEKLVQEHSTAKEMKKNELPHRKFKMTDKKKQKILKLVEGAENTFASYLTICQQIARLIQEETNEEIIDVLKQMSDGICVVINRENGAPLNIPVDEYLQEIENDS